MVFVKSSRRLQCDTYLQCVCNDQVPGRCWVDTEQYFIVVWLTCWRWVVLWRHWNVCLRTRTRFVPEFLHSMHRCSSTHSHGLWANSNCQLAHVAPLHDALLNKWYVPPPRRLCFCLPLCVCLSVCLFIRGKTEKVVDKLDNFLQGWGMWLAPV